MAEFKFCTKCKKEKPAIIDNFRERKYRGKPRLNSQCRGCEREYARKHGKNLYKENKELVLKRNKEFREKNKEYIREYHKEYFKTYYPEKKEELLEYQRQYRKKNKGKLSKRDREYYLKNKDYITERNKKWIENNKHKRREYNQTRRARVRNLKSDFTTERWKSTQRYFDYCCAYCGEEKELHQDHFIPVSSKGDYTATNIVPSCRSCNCSKIDHYFFEWYPRYKHYDENREKRIIDFLEDIKKIGE